MNIEDAIQQKRPFPNAQERALVNLIYTNNWATDQMKQMLKPFGITMQQYNVLRILRGAEKPLSTSVIRERLLDKMADTSRLVDRLCQKKLVLRKICPADKRLVDVSISEMGLQLIEKIHQGSGSFRNILSQLNEEEATQLNLLLDKIRG